jgi:hypothetical protein
MRKFIPLIGSCIVGTLMWKLILSFGGSLYQATVVGVVFFVLSWLIAGWVTENYENDNR